MLEDRYDAFISYSHEQTQAAERLQSALERFARPWYRWRALRIFRDTSGLAASSSLQGEIEKSLDRSQYLIVLASKTAAKSPWVDREIRHWLSMRSAERIILVLHDGVMRWSPAQRDFDWEVSDAAPPALKGVYPSEPLHVDLGADGRFTLRNPRFRRAIAQITARVRAVELDAILGEHLRRQRQTWVTVALVGLVLISLVVSGAITYRQSLADRKAKDEQARIAVSRQLALRARESLARSDSRAALVAGLASVTLIDAPVSRGALLNALLETRHLIWEIQASTSPVGAVALVPARQLLLTGDAKGSVAIFDRSIGPLRARFESVHPDGVTNIAVSKDGRYAASGGGARGGFIIWDLENLQAIHQVREGPGFALAFTPDGKWLLAGGDEGALSAWDVSRRRLVASRAAAQDGTIVDICIEQSGERIFTGSLFGVVRVWNRRTLKPGRVFDPDPATGASVDVSADGQMLVMAGGRSARQWSLGDDQPYGDPYVSGNRMVTHARFTGDAMDDVVLTEGNQLMLAGGTVARLGFHRSDIHSLTVDRGTRLLATGAADGSVRVWALDPQNGFERTFVLPGNIFVANSVAVSGDGSRVAIGAGDTKVKFGGERSSARGVIFIVDVTSGRLVGSGLEGHAGAIVDLAWSAEGRLASASDDGTVRLWNVMKGSYEIVSGSERRPAFGVAFSPSGRLLAFVRAHEPAMIWNLRQGAVVATDIGNATAVGFSPNSEILHVGTAAGELHSLRIDGVVRPAVSVTKMESSIDAVAFDNRGRAVLLLQGKPVFLESNAQRWQPALSGHVRSLAVGLRSAQFLELTGRLERWDLDAEEKVADLQAGTEGHFIPTPQQVSSSLDGNVVAVTAGARVTMFDLTQAALRMRACALAGEPMTASEWNTTFQTSYMEVCR